MRRRSSLAHDGRTFFALLLIGLWLAVPVQFASSDADFLDGFEQQESSEPVAGNRLSETYRIKRELSLCAEPSIVGVVTMSALPLLGAQARTTTSLKKTVKLHKFTQVYRC